MVRVVVVHVMRVFGVPIWSSSLTRFLMERVAFRSVKEYAKEGRCARIKRYRNVRFRVGVVYDNQREGCCG